MSYKRLGSKGRGKQRSGGGSDGGSLFGDDALAGMAAMLQGSGDGEDDGGLKEDLLAPALPKASPEPPARFRPKAAPPKAQPSLEPRPKAFSARSQESLVPNRPKIAPAAKSPASVPWMKPARPKTTPVTMETNSTPTDEESLAVARPKGAPSSKKESEADASAPPGNSVKRLRPEVSIRGVSGEARPAQPALPPPAHLVDSAKRQRLQSPLGGPKVRPAIRPAISVAVATPKQLQQPKQPPPSDSDQTASLKGVLIGTVTKKAQAHGFIHHPAIKERFGNDIWVHAGVLKDVEEGGQVEFSVSFNTLGKPQARNVKPHVAGDQEWTQDGDSTDAQEYMESDAGHDDSMENETWTTRDTQWRDSAGESVAENGQTEMDWETTAEDPDAHWDNSEDASDQAGMMSQAHAGDLESTEMNDESETVETPPWKGHRDSRSDQQSWTEDETQWKGIEDEEWEEGGSSSKAWTKHNNTWEASASTQRWTKEDAPWKDSKGTQEWAKQEQGWITWDSSTKTQSKWQNNAEDRGWNSSDQKWESKDAAAEGLVTGTVNRKGGTFGFIDSPEVHAEHGCKVFAPAAALQDFEVGDQVEFNVVVKHGKPQAHNVKKHNGGSASSDGECRPWNKSSSDKEWASHDSSGSKDWNTWETSGDQRSKKWDADSSSGKNGVLVGKLRKKLANFGFIQSPDAHAQYGCDVFAPASELADVEEGDQLEFSLVVGKQGKPQAQNVKKHEGGEQEWSQQKNSADDDEWAQDESSTDWKTWSKSSSSTQHRQKGQKKSASSSSVGGFDLDSMAAMLQGPGEGLGDLAPPAPTAPTATDTREWDSGTTEHWGSSASESWGSAPSEQTGGPSVWSEQPSQSESGRSSSRPSSISDFAAFVEEQIDLHADSDGTLQAQAFKELYREQFGLDLDDKEWRNFGKSFPNFAQVMLAAGGASGKFTIVTKPHLGFKRRADAKNSTEAQPKPPGGSPSNLDEFVEFALEKIDQQPEGLLMADLWKTYKAEFGVELKDEECKKFGADLKHVGKVLEAAAAHSGQIDIAMPSYLLKRKLTGESAKGSWAKEQRTQGRSVKGSWAEKPWTQGKSEEGSWAEEPSTQGQALESFTGTVKIKTAICGFIASPEVKAKHGCDAFVPLQDLQIFNIGDNVEFGLFMNHRGKPQAHSLKPHSAGTSSSTTPQASPQSGNWIESTPTPCSQPAQANWADNTPAHMAQSVQEGHASAQAWQPVQNTWTGNTQASNLQPMHNEDWANSQALLNGNSMDQSQASAFPSLESLWNTEATTPATIQSDNRTDGMLASAPQAMQNGSWTGQQPMQSDSWTGQQAAAWQPNQNAWTGCQQATPLQANHNSNLIGGMQVPSMQPTQTINLPSGASAWELGQVQYMPGEEEGLSKAFAALAACASNQTASMRKDVFVCTAMLQGIAKERSEDIFLRHCQS